MKCIPEAAIKKCESSCFGSNRKLPVSSGAESGEI